MRGASEKKVLSGANFPAYQKCCRYGSALIFRLATIEGMRPGELLGLQLRDVREHSALESSGASIVGMSIRQKEVVRGKWR